MTGVPPGFDLTDPTTAALLLLVFEGLFALRVGGQALVASRAPRWLPPMPEWYSGVVPYPRLVAIQIAMLAGMTLVAALVAGGLPGLVGGRELLGTTLVAIAWVYAGSMVVRYIVRMWRLPEARWTGRSIPIVFHVVLATWLLILGSYLRATA